MHRMPRRWTWWRTALCIVGALLLVAALVVVLEAPITYTTMYGRVGSYQTTVVSHNTLAIILYVALAVAGIVAISTSILFPRRRTGVA
jgi:hypothetical protein